MTRFLGTQELGIAVDWRYRFIPPGESADSTPGAVYLDTGGRLAPGVIDHHGLEGNDECAATLLVRHRDLAYNHLLGPLLAEVAQGRAPAARTLPIVVVCHEGPDFDAAVACLLLRHLIEDGDFPPYAPALAEYARRVDQGRIHLDARDPSALEAVHLAYLTLQYSAASDPQTTSSQETLASGGQLLEGFLAGVAAARQGAPPRRLEDLLPGAPGVGAWRTLEAFRPLAKLLDAEQEKFRSDLEQAELLESVTVPGVAGGEKVRVRAFVARSPARSALNRYWARAHGFPLTVFPYSRAPGGVEAGAEETAGTFARVVISLDPNYRTASGARPSLRGLGYRLEQMESQARERAGAGIDDRGGPPRFPDGYSESSDPWYDGRAHGWTIVDAPARGTILPYERIVDAVTTGDFWKLPMVRSELLLIWCGAPMEGPAAALAEEQPEDFARSLGPFFRDTKESPTRQPQLDIEFATGIRLRERFRRFPEGTCPPMRILTLNGERGAFLEELIEFRDRLVLGRPADFCFARIELAPYFGAWASTKELLGQLGGGDDLELLGGEGAGRQMLLFGRRAVILRTSTGRPVKSREGSEPILETLLYSAFLYDTLNVFSQRLGELMPPGRNLLSGARIRALREDFLRFQSRYYQLEFARGGDARMLFERLLDVLGVRELAAEVRAELDQVGSLEEQRSAERQERTERTLEALLYVLAVVGGLQTLINYLGWQGSASRLAEWSLGAVALASAAYYFLVWRHRARRGE